MKTNAYTIDFFALCPSNGARISYSLTIETQGAVLMVEDILATVSDVRPGYHEAIADGLFAAFGHRQVMTAHHHGVMIQTIRGAE